MTVENKEIRMSPDVNLACTRNDNGEIEEKPKIVGYAAVFNSLSEDLGGFREKIDRGAFADSLNDNDEVHALFNHDDDKILGRRGSGTLKVWEDDHGLRIEIDPPNTTDGNDVVELLRRGDLVSMSFGFYNVTDAWAKQDGTDVRTIKSARLFDVSVVTNPAYKATSVGVRNEVALRSLEKHLADEAISDVDMESVGKTIELNLRLKLAEQENEF
jgi:HK97 family phage prohead protease